MYAVHALSIDPSSEFDLLWIVEEALTAPLPDGWSKYLDEKGSGDFYYHNDQSGAVQWTSPMMKYYRELVKKERGIRSPAAGGNRAAAGAEEGEDEGDEETRRCHTPRRLPLSPRRGHPQRCRSLLLAAVAAQLAMRRARQRQRLHLRLHLRLYLRLRLRLCLPRETVEKRLGLKSRL
jgi:hypothetical protein